MNERYHILSIVEIANARKLHWAEVLLLNANMNHGDNRVEVNSVTLPILEKLK